MTSSPCLVHRSTRSTPSSQATHQYKRPIQATEIVAPIVFPVAFGIRPVTTPSSPLNGPPCVVIAAHRIYALSDAQPSHTSHQIPTTDLRLAQRPTSTPHTNIVDTNPPPAQSRDISCLCRTMSSMSVKVPAAGMCRVVDGGLGRRDQGVTASVSTTVLPISIR